MSKRYTWDFNRDAEIWGNESYDTIEECLAEAQGVTNNDYAAKPCKVYIGECIEFVPCVDVESMLDQINEQANDQCGEVGYDWDAYNHKKRDELSELQDKIDAIVHEWMKKYEYYPDFYNVGDIKEYDLLEATSNE